MILKGSGEIKLIRVSYGIANIRYGKLRAPKELLSLHHSVLNQERLRRLAR